MWTSSDSMRRNFWASSTTLASLPRGTPTPPRLNSIRMRNRDMMLSQPVHDLPVQAIFDRVARAFLAWREPRKVASCQFVIAPLHGNHDQATQRNCRIRRHFQQTLGIQLDTRQIETLYIQRDQVRQRFFLLRVRCKNLLVSGLSLLESP